MGVKWVDPQTGEDEPDPTFQASSERRKKREKEENNRLLYVAMTRAEEHLVLSAALANEGNRVGSSAQRPAETEVRSSRTRPPVRKKETDCDSASSVPAKTPNRPAPTRPGRDATRGPLR